jgi:hypothetical protein
MPEKNTKFSFDLEDLTPVIYIAETLSLDKLYEFIDKEKREVLPTLISIWWFYIKSTAYLFQHLY